MGEKVRLAVFVSGSGSNLQSIMDACADERIPGEVALVVSNKKKAYGLVRAEEAGIETIVYRRKSFSDGRAADRFLVEALKERKIDLIALAGYLKMLPPSVIGRYRNRIINIHPALLPKFGGKGMYGINVHRAVIEAGESESGVTIHLVDEIYDHGRVLAQEKVPVLPDDNPEELAARVLNLEHSLYPRVIEKISREILKENKK